MAQKKFWNYRDDDLTKDINRWLSGLIESGLYRGFDPILGAVMDLKLNHETTGAIRVDSQEAFTQRFGVLCTKQGVIVQDDTEISLPIAITSGAGRNDIIVYNHKYTEIEGGEAGFYSVIQGTATDFPLPADELTQTVIGYLTLPANCVSLNTTGVVYRRAPQPTFANHVAFVEKENGFFITNMDARLNKMINLANPTQNQDAATKYYVDQALINNIVHATETSRGTVRLATVAETIEGKDDRAVLTTYKAKMLMDFYRASQAAVDTGADGSKFITPKTLRNSFATVNRSGVIALATEQEAKDGQDNSKAITPFTLHKAFPMKPVIFQLDTWNTDTTLSKTIAHNLTSDEVSKVVSMNGILMRDDATQHQSLFEGDIKITDTEITVTLPAASKFDNAEHSANGLRGWVTVWIKTDLNTAPNVLSVNAGQDKTLGTNSNLTFDLLATVTSIGSALDTVEWSIVSKPVGSTVLFGDAANAATTLQADTIGAYVVRVTVTNADAEVATDDVVLTVVEATNIPPEILSITRPSVIDNSYTAGNEVTYGEVKLNSFNTFLSISAPFWFNVNSTEFSDNANNEVIATPIVGGHYFKPAVNKLVNFKGSVVATVGRFASDAAVVPQFDIVLRVNDGATGTFIEDIKMGEFSTLIGVNYVVYDFFKNVEAGKRYSVIFKLKTFVGTDTLSFNVTSGYMKWTTGTVLSFVATVKVADPDNDPISYSFQEVSYSSAGGFGAVIADSAIRYDQNQTTPNSFNISGLLKALTADVWYGFKVTVDDGNGGTDSEYFAVLVSADKGIITDKVFSMKFTSDSNPESNSYLGALTITGTDKIATLKMFIVNPDLTVSKLGTLVELSVSGLRNQLYSVGTHTINAFIAPKIDIDFSITDIVSNTGSASLTFKAYDSNSNLLGETTKLVTNTGLGAL